MGHIDVDEVAEEHHERGTEQLRQFGQCLGHRLNAGNTERVRERVVREVLFHTARRHKGQSVGRFRAWQRSCYEGACLLVGQGIAVAGGRLQALDGHGRRVIGRVIQGVDNTLLNPFRRVIFQNLLIVDYQGKLRGIRLSYQQIGRGRGHITDA